MLIYAEKEELRPVRANADDAGLDLRTEFAEVFEPGETHKISTGLYMEIPAGYVGLVFPRSSTGIKKGLVLANTVGVIDAGYRGEIMLFVTNTTTETQVIEQYERFAQIVFVPCGLFDPYFVDSLDELTETDRGAGGFGSTGND